MSPGTVRGGLARVGVACRLCAGPAPVGAPADAAPGRKGARYDEEPTDRGALPRRAPGPADRGALPRRAPLVLSPRPRSAPPPVHVRIITLRVAVVNRAVSGRSRLARELARDGRRAKGGGRASAP